jgi:hypothetical protein
LLKESQNERGDPIHGGSHAVIDKWSGLRIFVF